MIRSFVITIALLTATTCLKGQDGSDIRYMDISDVNASDIGKTIHLDFYNDSFRTGIRDTVMIPFGHVSLQFIEQRKDNGYTNWFSEQYLESITTYDGMKIKLVGSIIRDVGEDSILVDHYFEYYSQHGDPSSKEAVKQSCWVRRNRVNKVLVKSSQYK